MTKDKTEFPPIEYEYTKETAIALVENYPVMPDFDPSLGKKDPINKQIISDSKFWNKVESTREKIRKETKEPYLNRGREIDDRSKELHEIFEPMKTKYALARKSIDAWEAEQEQKRIDIERRRVEAISAEITRLADLPANIIGQTASQIEEIYDSVHVPDVEVFQERHSEALTVYRNSMEKLEIQILAMRKSEEADKIIAEEKAKAKEAKDKVDAEIKAEKEAFAKEKAELKAEREELDREKREKQEAEDMAKAEKEAEEMAESERVAEEANEEKRVAKAQSDRASQDKIHKGWEKEALEDLEKALDKDEFGNNFNGAIVLLEAIIKGEIRHVSWEL